MLNKLNFKSKIILFSLIIIPILIIVLLFSIKGCSKGDNYSNYEKKMINAAENYLKKKNKLPITEGGQVTVSLDSLIKEGYIKSPTSLLNDNSCDGSVSVRNNGVSVKENDGGFYYYIPDLKCDNYKTVHLIDKLMENLVTEKSGLYKTEDGYVYKGAKVKNYVKFFDKLYVVVSIDNNNILKLLKTDYQSDESIWDAKYNVEKDDYVGKNDYSDSYIIDVLYDSYLKTDSKKKKHLLAYNVCVGSRSLDNVELNNNEECMSRLENQFISLLNTADISRASYDKDCTTIYSRACSNYNYLRKYAYLTWFLNGVKESSYKVFCYRGGVSLVDASVEQRYNFVMYVDGNELYTKGDGSFSNPFIIND